MSLWLALALLLATPGMARPDKLIVTYNGTGCVDAAGNYTLLISGPGTVNQPIDWSPNKRFDPIGHIVDGTSNLLEGDSGALGFNVSRYPKGVWVRWSDHPKIVTHAKLPPRCT